MKSSNPGWIVLVLAIMVSGCDVEGQLQSLLYGSDESEGTRTLGDERQEEIRQQEEEPNDSRDQATPFPIDGEQGPMWGAIDPAGDVDWYGLELKGDEPWMVELRVEPQDDDLDVMLYLALEEGPDGEERAPLMYDLGEAGDEESIPMLKLDPEEVQYFFVTAADDDQKGEYRIDVQRRLSAASVAMEPNDHPELAVELEVPGEVQGFYDRPYDRDIYFVPAESLDAGIYGLELSAIADFSQRLRVYDSPELSSPVLNLSVGTERPAIIPNLSLSAGDAEGLYFVLEADDEGYDRDQGYRLRLIEHPPGDGYVVEREPNDSASSAQTIEFGKPVRGYLHSSSDVDRFKILVGDAKREEDEEEEEEEEDEEKEEHEDGEEKEVIDPWEGVPEKEQPEVVMQAHLRPLVEAHRFGFRYLPQDDRLDTPREEVASEVDDELVICNRTLDSGEYHLEVRSVESEEGFRPRSFDYEMKVINIAGLEGLEIEPNDTLEQADRLEMGGERIGFISEAGDVDVFAFVVGPDEVEVIEEEEEDIDSDDQDEDGPEEESDGDDPWASPEMENVRIDLRGNPLNLGFELMDDEGGRIANISQSGPGGDEQLEIDLPHGLYYLAVSASSGSSCEPYQIGVRQAGSMSDE